MAASIYLGNMILNATLRGVVFTMPARVYVSLHVGDPGLSGENEITTLQWPSYVRKDPALGDLTAAGFSAPFEKSVFSVFDLAWGAMDGGQALNISNFGIWDAEVGGNCLIIDQLSPAKIFYPGDDAAIRAGKLSATVI